MVVADRWTYDYEGYYINQQVNARRINGAGTLIEPEFVVAAEYPSGGPRVAANAAGFVVVWTRNGNVRARRILWDQNTGRITGRVIDGTSGLPLPDANVRVGRFHDLTDATGAYSILLTAGSYAADVELHGYASDTVPVVITAGGDTTQDFVLRRVPILRVAGTTVDDATGNANGVADINECFALRIELSNIGVGDATAVSAMLATTTANVTVQQGGSGYPDVPAGGAAANTVAFGIKTSPTFVPGTTIQFTLTVATAQGPFTLPVSLPTAAAVKRQAFDSSGPVRVENIWAPGGISSMHIPVTGIQGVITRVQVRIHATRPDPGAMRLSLFAPGGPEMRLVLFQSYLSDGLGTDCPADPNDLTFQDDAAASFQNAPPPHVGAYRPWDPLARLAGRSGTAANGIWTITASDLSDDRSVIECARLLITYHVAHSGECEEVAIAGTVTRSDTGAPVAGASVRTDTAFQTVTDADGRYRLAVTPGPHKIEVEAGGHSPGSAAVTAVVGSTVNADVALVPMVLAVDSIVVDDTGPGGNGNGRVDFDEAFRLSVRLSNSGAAGSNVVAALNPISRGVVVTRPFSAYLSLPADASGTNTPPFELRTTPGLTTSEPVLLLMTLVVGGGTVAVPVSLETGTPSGLPTAAFAGTDVVNVSGLAGPVAKVVAQTYVEAGPTYSTELDAEWTPGPRGGHFAGGHVVQHRDELRDLLSGGRRRPDLRRRRRDLHPGRLLALARPIPSARASVTAHREAGQQRVEIQGREHLGRARRLLAAADRHVRQRGRGRPRPDLPRRLRHGGALRSLVRSDRRSRPDGHARGQVLADAPWTAGEGQRSEQPVRAPRHAGRRGPLPGAVPLRSERLRSRGGGREAPRDASSSPSRTRRRSGWSRSSCGGSAACTACAASSGWTTTR